MPDYLSCGSCPVDFELADIVSFIEHKRQRCVDGNSDSDQLECIKCSKRFHTPWPLLFHIQFDHQIIIMRNLNHFSFPLTVKTAISSVIQADESVSMEIDVEINRQSFDHRNVFTQTVKTRSSSSCCRPRNLPPCCEKIEPQCFDEPCLCPSVSDVICTSETCFINRENKELETTSGGCCVCPQMSLKTESREVQTDLEYNDDVDINFLLSNNSENSLNYSGNDGNTFSEQTLPFTEQQYANNFPVEVEKNWDYYTSTNDCTDCPYLPGFENQNYQILMPNIHLQGNTNPKYAPLNSQLIVNNLSRNFTSLNNSNKPSDNLSLTKNPNLSNQRTSFQKANNSTHLKELDSQNPQTIGNTLIMFNNSPPQKDGIQLFSQNETCLIASSSELSTDYNINNYEKETNDNDRKEFRFLCPNCEKRFRQKVHLRKHIMSQHAHQKPHKCGQCGYTTVEKSHLTVHIRTHTGERPYTCRRCSYSSAQNCTLKSHYLRRHPGDQIECNLCTSYFITEQERNNHQRSCRIVNAVSNSGNSDQNNHGDNSDCVDSSKTE